MLHGLLVIGSGAGEFDAAQEPLDLCRYERRCIGGGLHGLHHRAGLFRTVKREQNPAVLHLCPDVGRIDLLGCLCQSQRVLPLALLAHQYHQEPVGAEVTGVDFNGVLQVGHGERAAGIDLALGTQHERLGVERLDHHRGGRLGAGLHAEDHATLRKHLADRNALFVED